MMKNCYKSCTKCTPGLPIDGGWSHWNKVSECTVSCGGGVKIWYRFCTEPSPDNGGKECEGSSKKEEPCNTQACPTEGKDLTDTSSSCQPYSKMGYCYCGEYQKWLQMNCKKSCDQYLTIGWQKLYK